MKIIVVIKKGTGKPEVKEFAKASAAIAYARFMKKQGYEVLVVWGSK